MIPSPHCLMVLVQEMALPLSRACCKAGSSMAARMAIMAITTSNSMRVKCFLKKLFLLHHAKTSQAIKV